MTQLKGLESKLVSKLTSNQQIVAISVDRLKVAQKLKKKHKISFTVLSDPKAKSLQAFKIANKLDDKTVKKYKDSYKIDVEGDSGEKHHFVAHPAVYVIRDGKVVLADVHVSYKDRTPIPMIIKALK